jgi:hypothetical protein
MTREEARQVEQQLTKRHPGDTVEVTRVPGGVWVEARNKGGWTFLHVADDSPPLTLLGAYPETEPGELPGARPPKPLDPCYSPSRPAGRLPPSRCACQSRRAAGVQAGRPSGTRVSPGMGWRVRARRKLSGLP